MNCYCEAFLFSLQPYYYAEFFISKIKDILFVPSHAIILKESIRFRAEKENSFIQKIKLLGM